MQRGQEVFDFSRRAVTAATSRREPIVLAPLNPREPASVEEVPCVPPIPCLGGKQCVFAETNEVCPQPHVASPIFCELPSMPEVSSLPLGHAYDRPRRTSPVSALLKQRSKRARSVPRLSRTPSLVPRKSKKKRKGKKSTSCKSKSGKKFKKRARSLQKASTPDSLESSSSGSSTPSMSTNSSATWSSSPLPQDSVPSLPPISNLPSLPPILSLSSGSGSGGDPSAASLKRVRFSLPRGEPELISLPMVQPVGLHDRVVYESVSHFEQPSFDERLAQLDEIDQFEAGSHYVTEDEIDEESDCVAPEEDLASRASEPLQLNSHHEHMDAHPSSPLVSGISPQCHHDLMSSDSSPLASEISSNCCREPMTLNSSGIKCDESCPAKVGLEHDTPDIPALELSDACDTSCSEGANTDGDEIQNAGGKSRTLSHFVDWQCLLDTGASHSIAPESLSAILGTSNSCRAWSVIES